MTVDILILTVLLATPFTLAAIAVVLLRVAVYGKVRSLDQRLARIAAATIVVLLLTLAYALAFEWYARNGGGYGQ